MDDIDFEPSDEFKFVAPTRLASQRNLMMDCSEGRGRSIDITSIDTVDSSSELSNSSILLEDFSSSSKSVLLEDFSSSRITLSDKKPGNEQPSSKKNCKKKKAAPSSQERNDAIAFYTIGTTFCC